MNRKYGYTVAILFIPVVLAAIILAVTLAGRAPAGQATPTPAPTAVASSTSSSSAHPQPTACIPASAPPRSTPGPVAASADHPSGGGTWGGLTDKDEQASFEAVYYNWQQRWVDEHALELRCASAIASSKG